VYLGIFAESFRTIVQKAAQATILKAAVEKSFFNARLNRGREIFLKESIEKISTVIVEAPNVQNVDIEDIAPTQFKWEKQWYPVAVEEYTDKNKTHAQMFLGNDVVLWYDGITWRLFEDSCPHRGVPLSEGFVNSFKRN